MGHNAKGVSTRKAAIRAAPDRVTLALGHVRESEF